MPDLLSRLSEKLDEVERVARATDVKQGDPQWFVSPVLGTGGEDFTVRSARDKRPIARVQRLDGDEGEPAGILDGQSAANHIASWGPHSVLRLVAAHREVIAEHRRALQRLREAVGGAPEHVALVTDRFKSLQRVIKLLAAGWGVQDEEG
jgi:hypothetical protein